MRNVIKVMTISLLAFGLAACDGETKGSKAPAGDAAASAQAEPVSLLGGKLTFALPNGMADQSSKLSQQSNNQHVFADSSGQRALIVIFSDKTPDSPATLAQRLEDKLRTRDANLQVITNKAIEINRVPLHQLDSIMTSGGQKTYSSVLIGEVDNQLLTLQVTLPADNPQQAQSEAATIISSVKLQP
jgi:hypothetical protein